MVIISIRGNINIRGDHMALSVVEKLREAELAADKKIKAAEEDAQKKTEAAKLEAANIIEQAKRDSQADIGNAQADAHDRCDKDFERYAEETGEIIRQLKSSGENKKQNAVEAVINMLI